MYSGETVDKRSKMWIKGEECSIEHCQHCTPVVWWLDKSPGNPPQFVFRGFPTEGQVVLSFKTIVVICRKCALPIELAKPDVCLNA